MDARLTFLRLVGSQVRRKIDRKVALAVVTLALLGACDAALSLAAPATTVPLPAVASPVVQRVATHVTHSTHVTHTTALPKATAQPGTTTQRFSAATAVAGYPFGGQPTAEPNVRHPQATPVVHHAGSNDPTEAQTPLHLSDPLSNDTALTPAAPWWQTLLDVTWKLALVVGLIYLAMRALAALKRRGFAPSGTAKTHNAQGQRHLLESLEEVQLAPNHVLHAVRVGDRVMLIARTNGTLRALGEADISDGAGDDAAPALPAAGFAGQLMRAWGSLLPSSGITEELPAVATPPDAMPAETAAEDDAVIDAKWSVKLDATPDPAPALPDLPLRRGTARADDEPPPFSAAEERDILWFAEENGDGAAAKKYGLTRQRVTAMRRRYDAQRSARPHPPAPSPSLMERGRSSLPAERSSATRAASNAGTRLASRAGEGLGSPDHPRGIPAAEPVLPATARTTAARTAYRQATTPARADVAVPQVTAQGTPADATEDQAVTVGQILAARFGIKVPETK